MKTESTEHPICVIAFCGPKGSGKSTAVQRLRELGWIRHRMAEPIKRFCHEILGIPWEFIDGSKKEESLPQYGGKSARHIMMTLGTEWGRNMVCPDIWSNAWKATLPKPNPSAGIVVDDVRFPNEIEMLRSNYKTFLIQLNREGFEYNSEHESEAHSDLGADYFMTNNGSVLDLHVQVADLLMENWADMFGS